MADQPRYRFRGSIEPSAEVARPVAARRTTAGSGSGGGQAGSSATLDIFDVIDSYGGWWGISAHDVDAALKQLGDVDTLYVRLNSPGGEATEGVAIANLLRAHKATVRATVYGIAASAASVIAVAADTVSMAPGSILMIHEASDIAWGDAGEMRKTAAALDAISDSYASLYALKAGGAADQWRETMRGELWLTAEAAVESKLADAVGLDPELPADLPPVEPDDGDGEVVVNVDVEINPAARAAARRFDLSMYAHAPAALAAATQTPAEPPETPPTNTEEADSMSDTLIQGLRERLGVAADADEATILAALDETLAEQTETPTAPAAAAVPDGSVVVPQAVLDELRIAAHAGQEARAVQLRQDRDDTIQAAISGGYVSRDRREFWTAQWDADPEGARASLATLTSGEPLFPVAALPGRAGGDNESGTTYTDEDAAADALLFGVPKEALKA